MTVDSFGVNELLGQPEVHHLHVPIRGEHDIGRVQISMHDAPLMRFSQGLGHLRGDLPGFSQSQRTFGKLLPQRLASHMLHRDKGLSVLSPNLIDLTDKRVI